MSQKILAEEECSSLIASIGDAIVGDLGIDFSLVGIVTGGASVAMLIASYVSTKYQFTPNVGSIDITLYRDDLYTGLERPALGVTDVPFSIDERPLVLVDDVLFTGRTVRAALQEINDLGRPSVVRLAVLIDRGHRELPIQADYVGQRIKTEKTDRISFSSGVVFLKQESSRDQKTCWGCVM